MLRSGRVLAAAVVVAACSWAGVARAADAPAPGAPSAGPVYERDVRPILKAHCFHCHGEDGSDKGSLDVRLRRLIVEVGGKSGPAVVPGKPDESRLYQLVRDGKMPKGDGEKRLSDAEVSTLRRWIEAGAPTLRPEPQEVPAVYITEEDRAF